MKNQRRFGLLAVPGLLLLVFTMIGCMSMDMSAAPETRGAMSGTSGNALFRVSIQSKVEPIPMNAVHAWILHIETGDGQPVDDAIITVDGGMPAHGHGLPTQPRVTENLGNGDYLVEGMKFQMQGQWEVRFEISAGNSKDTVTIEFEL